MTFQPAAPFGPVVKTGPSVATGWNVTTALYHQMVSNHNCGRLLKSELSTSLVIFTHWHCMYHLSAAICKAHKKVATEAEREALQQLDPHFMRQGGWGGWLSRTLGGEVHPGAVQDYLQ